MEGSKKIAEGMFSDGLRSRDYAAREKMKKYDKQMADEILEELAKIEIIHLNNQGA